MMQSSISLRFLPAAAVTAATTCTNIEHMKLDEAPYARGNGVQTPTAVGRE